jgi:hypothetical protein
VRAISPEEAAVMLARGEAKPVPNHPIMLRRTIPAPQPAAPAPTPVPADEDDEYPAHEYLRRDMVAETPRRRGRPPKVRPL